MSNSLTRTTQTIISDWVKANQPVSSQEVYARLEKSFFDEVKKEIVDIELNNMRDTLRDEEADRDKLKRIRGAKALLLEGLLLAFLVGLIVNQTTEVFAYLKGQSSDSINMIGTLWILGIGIILLVMLSILSYYNKFETIFIDKEKK